MNNADLGNIVALVQKELSEIGVQSVLIGALAPALQIVGDLTLALANPIHATKDIDAIVNVDSWAAYTDVIEKLLQKGFEKTSPNIDYKLLFHGVEIDLLPAGAGIIKNDRITWPKSELTMNMTGMNDVLKHQQTIKSSDGQDINVAPLWATVVLKLFAYMDRKIASDVEDVVTILQGYAADEDRRYLRRPELMFENSGAYACGQDIKKLAASKTRKATIEMLEEQLVNEEYSSMVSLVIPFSGDVDRRLDVYNIFKALLAGLKEG